MQSQLRLAAAILLVGCAGPAMTADRPGTNPAGGETASKTTDRDALVGTWKIVSFMDDGSDRIGRLGVTVAPPKKGQPERIAKLVVTRDEVFVIRADGKRDRLAGLTNCAWTTFALDERASPKAIDITGVPKAQAAPKPPYYGIYETDGKTLRICWAETPKSRDPAKARPREFKSDGDNSMLVCERITDVPEDPKE